MCLIQRAADVNILARAVDIAIASTQEPTQQIQRGKREVQAELRKLKDNRRHKRRR